MQFDGKKHLAPEMTPYPVCERNVFHVCAMGSPISADSSLIPPFNTAKGGSGNETMLTPEWPQKPS